ncbi:hypothetical protein MMC18_002640 [Xylographa bjoerkii]|nr:hypothetical protein [Xylographa bjoerkii]
MAKPVDDKLQDVTNPENRDDESHPATRNQENVIPVSRQRQYSTDEQDDLVFTPHGRYSGDSINSPTLPTPIRVYHSTPQNPQTEDCGLVDGHNNKQVSVQKADTTFVLQEPALDNSTPLREHIVDTHVFQEDLFMGLPARRTRATKRKLEKIANAELPSPTKNPDDAEGSGDNSDDDSYRYEAPVEKKEEIFDKDDTPCSDTCMDMSISNSGYLRKPKHQVSKRNLQSSPACETENRQAWEDWYTRKGDIQSLLVTPQYGIPGSHGHEYESVKVPALTELENHGIYSVEQRVCVVNFKYSDFAFSDFARRFPLYLKLLEDAAGRNCGVVKVILPHFSGETRRPTEILTSDQLLCTQRSRSVKNGASHGEIVTFEVKSIEQNNVMYSSGVQFEAPDSVKDGFEFDCKEREFLTRAQAAFSTATSTMKTADGFDMARVRYALGLNAVELSILPENTRIERVPTVSATDSVEINVVQSEGMACGMRINKEAAYSISYLHKGAAKIWTVVKPFEHAKFEEMMHMMTSSSLVKTQQGNRPRFPPQCDQFLGHKELYVPGYTLEALDVDYRQVVQEQNEMIIIFPYAYHQAYDSGANISEEMPYSNKRSDIFLTRDLCRLCGSTCLATGLHLQMSSIQEGQGSLVRRRVLARKGAKPENKDGRQYEDSDRVSKRKLDDRDTLSISKSSELSGKKKRALRRSTLRGSGEGTEIYQEINQVFTNDYAKNS